MSDNKSLIPLPDHDGYFYDTEEGLVYILSDTHNYVAVGCYRSQDNHPYEEYSLNGSYVVPFTQTALNYVKIHEIQYDEDYFKNLQEKVCLSYSEHIDKTCDHIKVGGVNRVTKCDGSIKVLACVSLIYNKVLHHGHYRDLLSCDTTRVTFPNEYDPTKLNFLCKRHCILKKYHVLSTL